MFAKRSSTLIRPFCYGSVKSHSKFATAALCISNRNLNIRNNIQPLFKSNVMNDFKSTSFSQYSTKVAQNHLQQNEQVVILNGLPDVKMTRQVVNPKDKSGLDLVLFQYQTCPFCCKVRVFLDSRGLSYSVVEVDAVLRQSTKWSSYKKVPMMLVRIKDGKYVQLTDSSAIVSILATVLNDPEADLLELAKYYASKTEGKEKSELPTKYYLKSNESSKSQSEKSIVEERKWRAWTDSHLINLISPNVYGTPSEALETFQWFSKAGQWDVAFPRWERHLMVYSGATIMYLISKRLKKRYNLSDDVRKHIYDACNQWISELNGSSFHGGQTPNLADLAVFGALNSFEGCKAFEDIKNNTQIETWFTAVRTYVEANKGNVIKS